VIFDTPYFKHNHTQHTSYSHSTFIMLSVS